MNKTICRLGLCPRLLLLAVRPFSAAPACRALWRSPKRDFKASVLCSISEESRRQCFRCLWHDGAALGRLAHVHDRDAVKLLVLPSRLRSPGVSGYGDGYTSLACACTTHHGHRPICCCGRRDPKNVTTAPLDTALMPRPRRAALGPSAAARRCALVDSREAQGTKRPVVWGRAAKGTSRWSVVCSRSRGGTFSRRSLLDFAPASRCRARRTGPRWVKVLTRWDGC